MPSCLITVDGEHFFDGIIQNGNEFKERLGSFIESKPMTQSGIRLDFKSITLSLPYDFNIVRYANYEYVIDAIRNCVKDKQLHVNCLWRNPRSLDKTYITNPFDGVVYEPIKSSDLYSSKATKSFNPYSELLLWEGMFIEIVKDVFAGSHKLFIDNAIGSKFFEKVRVLGKKDIEPASLKDVKEIKFCKYHDMFHYFGSSDSVYKPVKLATLIEEPEEYIHSSSSWDIVPAGEDNNESDDKSSKKNLEIDIF